MGGFEHIEHTADIGVKAWDETLEGCFEQATLGVLDIMAAWRPGDSDETVPIEVRARDLGGVLVDWLSEVLYIHESRDAVVTAIDIDSVDETEARGTISISDRDDEVLEGTAVKAVTYHQLDISPSDTGWAATLIVDV